MLPKKKRLTTSLFNRFFASGQRHHTKNLQIIHHPYETFHGAVVVGKKVSKKAVVRNKLRRQIYAQLYQYYKKTNCTGVFIIIAKPSALTTASKTLNEELKQQLGKIESPSPAR